MTESIPAGAVQTQKGAPILPLCGSQPARPRLCSRCGLPNAHYPRRWSHNGPKRYVCRDSALQAWCRACRIVYMRAYRQRPEAKHAERIRSAWRRWATKYPALLAAARGEGT